MLEKGSFKYRYVFIAASNKFYTQSVTYENDEVIIVSITRQSINF